jgi:Cu(I)/Ag(I) efflux system membrane fusion protein
VSGAKVDGAPAGARVAALVRWGLVLGLAALAVLSIVYVVASVRRSSGAAAAGGGGETLWTCAMHPQIVRDRPGECPICGMTLVPKLRASSGDGSATAAASAPPGLAAVDLTPDRVQLIGMRTAVAERATLGDSLRAVAVLAPSERGLAQISVRFAGWVGKLMVAETGQRVRRGEVLATIYAPDVLRAEQELLTAAGWAARAAPPPTGTPAAGGSHADLHTTSLPDLAADARRRLELLGVAGQEIDDLIARGKVDETVPIRSPVAGFITAKNVVPGAAISPGAPLFEVADLSRVWALADVYEQDAARLHVGQKASLELGAYPGEHFAGRVQLIYPTLNAATRTLRVRVELANRPGPGGVKLRPGMYGNLALDLPTATGVVIPAEAVVDTGEHKYVFVTARAGHFEPRSVETGVRVNDQVQITKGLAAGEAVATDGNFLIDSESRLRAAAEGHGSAGPGK